MHHADTAPASQSVSFDPDEVCRNAARSTTVAWWLIVGLPGLGIAVSLYFGLPLFAALMGGSFLTATVLVCRSALVRFTGHVLRLLVTARLVIVAVLGALLLCASGSAWVAIVSSVLLWLTAERLVGRRALSDLVSLVGEGREDDLFGASEATAGSRLPGGAPAAHAAPTASSRRKSRERG